MHLDIVSSLISIGAIAALMGFWMLAASFAKGETNALPLRIWGISSIGFGVAYGLFAARGQIPLAWSLVLGNLIFALAYCGFSRAIAQVFKRPFPLIAAVVSVLICTFALSLTEIVANDPSWRVLILAALTVFPWTVSFLQSCSEWKLRRTPHVLALAVFFLAILVVSATRVAYGAYHGSFGYEGLPTGPGYLVGTHILIISPVLLTVGFFLLCEQKNQEEIKRLAETDDLTGIPNRRSVFMVASNRMASARRRGEELSCVTFDLDRFKTINDRFGHSAGDQALIHVSSVIRKLSRKEDVFGRLGGDEFAVFLPHTSLATARELAERYREALASQPLLLSSGELVVTASFGVACIHVDDQTPMDILNRADAAMYLAKEHGRNTVEFTDSSLS